MLFPPRTKMELLHELEDDTEISSIAVSCGPKDELLSREFAQSISTDEITVIVLCRAEPPEYDIEVECDPFGTTEPKQPNGESDPQ